MTRGFLEIATTPGVRAARARMGADHLYRSDPEGQPVDRLTDKAVAFIAARDSFYIATVSETGWPYVQHRGGPPGFLKVVNDGSLAFADYRGNRQYISVGNLASNDRACLFLMDYPRRTRLKMYTRVETLALDADPALTDLVTMGGYRARLERVVRLRVQAFDWNCPQHIAPRFTQQDVAEAVRPLRERLAALEAENADLRAALGQAGAD